MLNHCSKDFEGQRLAELITTILLSVTGVRYHHTLFRYTLVDNLLLCSSYSRSSSDTYSRTSTLRSGLDWEEPYLPSSW